jgi:tyrosine-protein kinase Etk/Wzc
MRVETQNPENGRDPAAIEPIEPPRVDVYGIALTLAQHKWLILGTALVGAALMAAAAWRMPPEYTATAAIMPPPQQRPVLAALLGTVSPAAGVLAGDLMHSPADLYVALLGSRSVGDGVIQDRRLMKHYEAKTMAAARARLAGTTAFASGKDTLVRIKVRDNDPREAAAIANAYIDQLYRLTSRFAIAESAQRRTFYEKQLENESRELAAAEAAMRAIQERTGLLQVSSQVDATIRSVAQLQAEITAREAMLDGMQAAATDQNPEVIRVRAEIGSLRTRLRELESSRAVGGAAGPVLPAGKVPGAGLQYARALRDLRYHETLYEALARQHEVARIDEAKEATVVQVVDYAVPPERKSGPRRLLLVVLAAFSSAVLAAAAVLTHKSMAEPERASRLRPVFQALWRIR